jgi:hypothetical protein
MKDTKYTAPHLLVVPETAAACDCACLAARRLLVLVDFSDGRITGPLRLREMLTGV